MSLLPENIELNPEERERLEELLVNETTQGLGTADFDELNLLLERAGLPTDQEEFDSGSVVANLQEAAAVAELSLLQAALEQREGESGVDAMPVHVEAELRQLAAAEAKRARRGEVVPFEQAKVVNYGLSPAWWLAAAALFLALIGWWPRLSLGRTATGTAAIATHTSAPSPTSAGATTSAIDLSTAPDTVTLAFQATEDPAATAAGGTLLWNPVLQRGEMRIDDLEVNDPTVFQYQLWIFDAERDERHPVDGGVFDIAESGAVTIAIDARVPVSEASLFAITIEPPGGVVVSKRERIVLIAQPS